MTTNPTFIKFVNEQVRPDAERIRAAYARGVDFCARLAGAETILIYSGGCGRGKGAPCNGR